MPGMARKFMNVFQDVVSQNDSIDSSTRKALLHKVGAAYDNEPSPVLAIIGETGVGKTTTVNSLFNAGQEVGHYKATTMKAIGLEVYVDHVQGRRGDLRVIDMPGLGDNLANYEKYLRLYLETLPNADAILWVHPAADRMVHLTQQVIADLVRASPDLRSRIVFGLNKADEINPNDWNPLSNTPSPGQEFNLNQRIKDFSRLIQPHLQVRRPAIVAYSALRRYKLATLFRVLMDAVPKHRRWVLESRMDLADFIELVDRGMLRAAQERIRTVQSRQARVVPADPTSPQRSGIDEQQIPLDVYLKSLSPDEYAALVADRDGFLELLRQRG